MILYNLCVIRRINHLALITGLTVCAWGCNPQCGIKLYAEADPSRRGEESRAAAETDIDRLTGYQVSVDQIQLSPNGREWIVIYQGSERVDISQRTRIASRTIDLMAGTYAYAKVITGRIDAAAERGESSYAASYSGLAGQERLLSAAAGDFTALMLRADRTYKMTLRFCIKKTIGYNEDQERINLYEPRLILTLL